MAYNKSRLNQALRIVLRMDEFYRKINDELDKITPQPSIADPAMELADFVYVMQVLQDYLKLMTKRVEELRRTIDASICFKCITENMNNLSDDEKIKIIGWIATCTPDIKHTVMEPTFKKHPDRYHAACDFFKLSPDSPAVKLGMIKFDWEILTEFFTDYVKKGGKVDKEIFFKTYDMLQTTVVSRKRAARCSTEMVEYVKEIINNDA